MSPGVGAEVCNNNAFLIDERNVGWLADEVWRLPRSECPHTNYQARAETLAPVVIGSTHRIKLAACLKVDTLGGGRGSKRD